MIGLQVKIKRGATMIEIPAAIEKKTKFYGRRKQEDRGIFVERVDYARR